MNPDQERDTEIVSGLAKNDYRVKGSLAQHVSLMRMGYEWSLRMRSKGRKIDTGQN